MYSEKDVIAIMHKIGVELPRNALSAELIEDGLMDSLQIIQLFEEVEKAVGKPVDWKEINPDNLKNIEAVLAMMNRLSHDT